MLLQDNTRTHAETQRDMSGRRRLKRSAVWVGLRCNSKQPSLYASPHGHVGMHTASASQAAKGDFLASIAAPLLRQLHCFSRAPGLAEALTLHHTSPACCHTYMKYVTTSCIPSSQWDSASLIMWAACITLSSSTKAAHSCSTTGHTQAHTPLKTSFSPCTLPSCPYLPTTTCPYTHRHQHKRCAVCQHMACNPGNR